MEWRTRRREWRKRRRTGSYRLSITVVIMGEGTLVVGNGNSSVRETELSGAPRIMFFTSSDVLSHTTWVWGAVSF